MVGSQGQIDEDKMGKIRKFGYGVIYYARCIVTDLYYIGKTTKLFYIRKNQHLSCLKGKKKVEPHSKFKPALRKYGAHNFEWGILEICNSEKKLNKAERKWIKKYDSYHNGYNCTEGGEKVCGYRTPEHCKNISIALTGVRLSLEHCKTISIKTKEAMARPDVKENLVKMLKARIPSAQSNERRSKALTGRIIYWADKIGKANSGENNGMFGKKGELSPRHGVKHTAESKEKNRQSQLRNHRLKKERELLEAQSAESK